jgi:hypothetical protein
MCDTIGETESALQFPRRVMEVIKKHDGPALFGKSFLDTPTQRRYDAF